MAQLNNTQINGNLTVTGKASLASTASTTPTSNYDLTSKKYVDDQISELNSKLESRIRITQTIQKTDSDAKFYLPYGSLGLSSRPSICFVQAHAESAQGFVVTFLYDDSGLGQFVFKVYDAIANKDVINSGNVRYQIIAVV